MCPRAGVPYPERVLCSLKNTIAMIEQKLGLKIEKVNGVGPDPQGNVTLVSGDSALTIEEDASQHQVTIGLDRAELPSAAVTSVNNATGAVHLIGADIRTGVYSPGNSATQDISTTRAAITGVNQNVAAEATARQNADAALQTNINNVTMRVTTAEGQIVTIEGRVTALETADGQNVKINNINQYAVGLTGNQFNIYGVKEFNSEIRRNVTGNYQRGILSRNSLWKIGETVDSQVTYWPFLVSNEGITDYPLLFSMSENQSGDLFGIECKGQNNLQFGLRVICTSTDVSLYLVSGNTTQLISRITR